MLSKMGESFTKKNHDLEANKSNEVNVIFIKEPLPFKRALYSFKLISFIKKFNKLKFYEAYSHLPWWVSG